MTNRRPFGFLTDLGHVVRADVLDQYAVKQDSRQLPTQEQFEGEAGLLVPRYDPAQLAFLLEQSTAHLVAARQKSEDVVGRGWDIVQTADDADPADRDRLREFFDAIPAPTKALDSHSNRDVFTAAQLDFEALGRGAFELIRRNHDPAGPVSMIVHVPAHTLRLHHDEVRFVQRRGGRRRWFKWAGASVDVDFETGEIADLGELDAERRATEIVWWRNYHPRDPVYGIPDIVPAIGAIIGDLGRRDFNIDFFQNFGIPSYAIFVTGDFDPGRMVDKDGNVVDDEDPAAVMTETEYHIQQLLKTVRANPHSSLVFTIPTRDGAEDGKIEIKFEPLATDVKEASFRLYRKDNREEVLSAHRMSAAIAGVFDAGQANREARSQYRQAVILPRRAMLETIVNEFIVRSLNAPGWRWALAPADARDADAVLDRIEKALRFATITPREARRLVAPLVGIAPDVPRDADHPALDRFYINGQPVDQIGEADAETGTELRGLRDDLVAMARKANGHDPLADLIRGAA